MGGIARAEARNSCNCTIPSILVEFLLVRFLNLRTRKILPEELNEFFIRLGPARRTESK